MHGAHLKFSSSFCLTDFEMCFIVYGIRILNFILAKKRKEKICDSFYLETLENKNIQ